MLQPFVDARATEAVFTLSDLNRVLKHKAADSAQQLFVYRILKASDLIAHLREWMSVRRGRFFSDCLPTRNDVVLYEGHCANIHSGRYLERTNLST